ncbi:chromate transporter [Paenibacillus soyae]|uniref:Chromate transporter n=1 Tax=Paenibacillus soyae TaxID=2969249 RepID=A0A9X2SC35_9BACL|nr:chromate transporter [Paenibacillus soyae]MCR2807650.1 chromate transporter [Paenibacillus soyae]
MKQDTAPTLLLLFWTFLKLSPISFGGGYAIFPALEREIVDKRQWMKSETLVDTLSLASAAPGGVGVNAALLVGYRLNGWQGAVAACCGSILPSFFIVIALFAFYSKIADAPKTEAVLAGITWGVITLILFSALRIGKKAIKDKTTLFLLLAALIGLFIGLSPVYGIAAGIAAGLIFTIFKKNVPEETTNASAVREDPSYMYFI